MSRFRKLIVTGLGSGYLPIAPGTWSSAAVAAIFLLVAWATEQGPERRFGIEGSGSYGAAFARLLVGAGETVVEVPERIAADGSVLEPLDPTSLDERIEALAADGIEVAAVALLHSYCNPVHENRLEDIVGESGVALTGSVALARVPAPGF